jgi:hypothetical protein
VVVVEPDPDIRLHLLNGRYEVLVAATESDVRNLLAKHVGEIEMILVDISLNGTEGVCGPRSPSEKTALGPTCRSLPQWHGHCLRTRTRLWRQAATAISSSRCMPRKCSRESTTCLSALAPFHPHHGGMAKVFASSHSSRLARDDLIVQVAHDG